LWKGVNGILTVTFVGVDMLLSALMKDTAQPITQTKNISLLSMSEKKIIIKMNLN